MSGPRFVGIDLAWKAKALTGLAVVDESGRLLASRTAITDDEIVDWVKEHRDVVVVAVDAPIVVPNETGQRVGETEVARAFGRYGASPYSSSRANPLFVPPRAAVLAERMGWTTDPSSQGSASAPVCIEVYPHPAMVGLWELPQRILYKKGPARAAGFAELMRHLEGVAELRLDDYPRWPQMKEVVATPQPGDLTRLEDELDAILCAHLAWLWHFRPQNLRVYGSWEEGYIVAPPTPTHAAVTTPRATAGRSLTVDVTGRPTGDGGTEDELKWKQAVREAFGDADLVGEPWVSIELEFRLGSAQISRNEPDLDNLITSTIDSLENVLGRRTGTSARVEADDVRVDRIVASKRSATASEASGARIVIRAI